MAIIALQSSTQWDSLAHLWYDDLLYNGYPATTITAAGAAHNGIGNLVNGVASRGVLLDVASWLETDWLPDDHAITPADLDAVVAHQGCDVRPGDVLVVRTGLPARHETDGAPFNARQPGLELTCARWLHDRDVAAVCADNVAVEVMCQPRGLPSMSFHMVALRDMGLLLGELFVLEELAQACAGDGIWDFFFTAPPLAFRRAVGSPINPLAIR
jgi:kynurenine formamidase